MDLSTLTLNTDRFLRVLGDMVAVGERLQNSLNKEAPPPQEDLAGDIVVEELRPLVRAGKLRLERVSYAEGRGNLILTYPGRTDRTVAFVGAHLDVVPADPAEWRRPPFRLHREGGRLYGRGVTDCLGHVAVLTDLFRQLAESDIVLDHTVVGVIIANEELSRVGGIGIGRLVKDGRLSHLKAGPVYWLDSADFGPTLATGGMAPWRLRVEGKAAHSGFPQDGINAAELAFEATRALQGWFYAHYPPHPKEREYGFQGPSSLKPTRVTVHNDTLSKIPASAVVEGDIRLTPWYSAQEVRDGVTAFINNLDILSLPTLGPSRYRLGAGEVGTVKLESIGLPAGGIVCDRSSVGYQALAEAVAAVQPNSRPFSVTGGLPYVHMLQTHGFDIQITGFGRLDTYHAPNEFAELIHMHQGFEILCRILARFG